MSATVAVGLSPRHAMRCRAVPRRAIRDERYWDALQLSKHEDEVSIVDREIVIHFLSRIDQIITGVRS
jgi:hypothetical protein